MPYWWKDNACCIQLLALATIPWRFFDKLVTKNLNFCIKMNDLVSFQLMACGQSGILGKTVLFHAEVVRRRKPDLVLIQNHNTVEVSVWVMELKQRSVITNTVQVN